MRRLLLIPFLFSLAACQHTNMEKVASHPDRTICKQRTDERTVEILPFEEKGCHVQYTKFSTAKTIAKAQGEKGFCLKVKEKIVTNLTNSGFVCE
jgi:hypothetical protein